MTEPADDPQVVVVLYRTANGRTLYQQVPDHVAHVETLVRGDAELAILTNDPVAAADVLRMTLSEYASIAEANPTWVEITHKENEDA